MKKIVDLSRTAALLSGLVSGFLGAMLPSVSSYGAALSSAGDAWEKVKTVPLPGSPSRFDYMSLGSGGKRLYIAHLGDSRLIVFDTGTGTVVANLPGFPHAHGVLFVPGLDRIFVTVSPDSRTKTGQVEVVNSRTLRTIAHIPVGIHPDGLDFDRENGRLFVSNEWGGSVSVIEAITGQTVGTIPLGGEAGNTRYDPVSNAVYTTVQTRDLLARTNPDTLRVENAYPVPEGCHPHGLWIDGARHQAFIACEGNASLLVFDLATGRVTGHFPVGVRPDVLAVDERRHLLFVASESGRVAVFRIRGRRLETLSDTFLGFRAHTIAVDPVTRRLYLPLENAHGHPVLDILLWGNGPGKEKGALSSGIVTGN